MKKVSKILSLVLVFALALVPFGIAFADGSIDEPNFTADSSFIANTQAKTWIGYAIGALQFVGYGIAVIMLLWLGIQFMFAQPAKKAELKSKMWFMLIGIIILVGATTIISAVWSAANTLSTSTVVY